MTHFRTAYNSHDHHEWKRVNQMNIEATGLHSFPFFPLPHHQGFGLGSQKVWKWLYYFLKGGDVWFHLQNAYRERIMIFFPATPAPAPKIRHPPRAGGGLSCLLQMDPVKVPR